MCLLSGGRAKIPTGLHFYRPRCQPLLLLAIGDVEFFDRFLDRALGARPQDALTCEGHRRVSGGRLHITHLESELFRIHGRSAGAQMANLLVDAGHERIHVQPRAEVFNKSFAEAELIVRSALLVRVRNSMRLRACVQKAAIAAFLLNHTAHCRFSLDDSENSIDCRCAVASSRISSSYGRCSARISILIFSLSVSVVRDVDRKQSTP
jgi:hypothetical protein